MNRDGRSQSPKRAAKKKGGDTTTPASPRSVRSRSQSPNRGPRLAQSDNKRLNQSDHHPKRGKRPPNNKSQHGRPNKNALGASNHSTGSRPRGRPKGSKPGRPPPARVNSLDPEEKQQRSRSQSPRTMSRNRSTSPRTMSRNRSTSPRTMSRNRSTSPRTMSRNRSTSPRTMSRNRSTSPRTMSRNRSTSPRTMSRNRSTSPGRARGRSLDPQRQNNNTDRSQSRNHSGKTHGSRSRSRPRPHARFDDNVPHKEYPAQQPPGRRRGQRRRRISHGISRRLNRRSSISVRGKEFTWCQLIHYAIPVSIMIGACVGLIYATGHGDKISDALGGLIPTLNNSDIKDPFSDKGAPHWPVNGKGVTLTMVNNLDDKWQITFTRAVMNWNLGDPNVAKSIEIIQEDGTPDPSCKPPDEKIAVCNGNYGESKWRGITESTVDGQGRIYSTAAKMNEYYLLNMPSGAWLYTMCHELGHTLGLAHTDENFENSDLGDCMDYTNNLSTNARPTALNFSTLFSIYGAKQPSGRQRQRNLLRGRRSKDDEKRSFGAESTQSRVPAYIAARQEEAVKMLLQRIRDSPDDGEDIQDGHVYEDGWKVIHKRKHGEVHEMELGEGFKVRVQLLLAN